MTSIHTNIAAKRSLTTLREITSSLATTRLAATTGLRISAPTDNAAYWSIATTLRGDMATRSAIGDALNLSLSIVDTAYEGVNSVIGIMTQMRDKFTIAINANDEDRAKIEGEVLALRQSFVSVVHSANFAGENWLLRESLAESTSRSLITGVVRNSLGGVTVQKSAVDLAPLLLIDTSTTPIVNGILTRQYSATDGVGAFLYSRHAYRKTGTGEISVVSAAGTFPATATSRILASVRMIDMMLTDLTKAASTFGAMRTGLGEQVVLNQTFADVETRSLGRLVDADMGDTAARSRALETRQQLAVQALNLANAAPDNILALFR